MKRNVLTQYLIITASCALYAVGFNWMFDPNHISVGGFTGGISSTTRSSASGRDSPKCCIFFSVYMTSLPSCRNCA